MKRLTIDEINDLPGNRDVRSMWEQARDQAKVNARLALDGARQHLAALERTPSAAACGPALRIAKQRLADAEAAARAAGVPA